MDIQLEGHSILFYFISSAQVVYGCGPFEIFKEQANNETEQKNH